MVILPSEDVPLLRLFEPHVYQDLVDDHSSLRAYNCLNRGGVRLLTPANGGTNGRPQL
jgi:hypothetical protein